MLWVPAKTNHPIEVLNMLKINIGLRPTLSDKDPSKGAEKNEQKENTVKRSVMVKGSAPKDLT